MGPSESSSSSDEDVQLRDICDDASSDEESDVKKNVLYVAIMEKTSSGIDVLHVAFGLIQSAVELRLRKTINAISAYSETMLMLKVVD
jgi:hypothetical protein